MVDSVNNNKNINDFVIGVVIQSGDMLYLSDLNNLNTGKHVEIDKKELEQEKKKNDNANDELLILQKELVQVIILNLNSFDLSFKGVIMIGDSKLFELFVNMYDNTIKKYGKHNKDNMELFFNPTKNEKIESIFNLTVETTFYVFRLKNTKDYYDVWKSKNSQNNNTIGHFIIPDKKNANFESIVNLIKKWGPSICPDMGLLYSKSWEDKIISYIKKQRAFLWAIEIDTESMAQEKEKEKEKEKEDEKKSGDHDISILLQLNLLMRF